MAISFLIILYEFSNQTQAAPSCDDRFAAEASENLLNVESRTDLLVRGRLRPPPMAVARSGSGASPPAGDCRVPGTPCGSEGLWRLRAKRPRTMLNECFSRVFVPLAGGDACGRRGRRPSEENVPKKFLKFS
ncbi:MAG: hypothetical protein IJF84_15050 [Thermoguttaceae bacterium]|nr:hypothetical protein [Thermoguttaceae bacterium]